MFKLLESHYASSPATYYGFKSKATPDDVLLIVQSHLIIARCAIIELMFELDIFREDGICGGL